MKIKQIKSNVTELTLNNGTVVMFSYQTPVAANVDGKFIRTSTKYSVTTSKHITQWLNGASAELVEQSVIDNLVKD